MTFLKKFKSFSEKHWKFVVFGKIYILHFVKFSNKFFHPWPIGKFVSIFYVCRTASDKHYKPNYIFVNEA